MSESKHFKNNELACRCGCGLNNVKPELLKLLEEVRNEYGSPLFITSGSRCDQHNSNVGSRSNSHPNGLAVDISCRNSRKRRKLLYLIIQKPFIGIGIKKDCIHVDINPRWHGQGNVFTYD